LMLANRKPRKPLVNITRTSVIELNQWMTLNAHKSIFSDSHSQEVQDSLDKTKEDDNLKIRVS
jgi:predicted amino acid-binding ACT domain protein